MCVCACVCDLLFGKVADEPELCVFLLVFQQLSHSVTQVEQHAAFGCDKSTHNSVVFEYV